MNRTRKQAALGRKGYIPWEERVSRIVTRFAVFFSAHWLFIANCVVGFYAGLPLLAPLLMHWGLDRLASWIYALYRPLCHQLPERSFFLFGPAFHYDYQTLYDLLGGNVPARYVGNPQIGFKLAVCERDTAIYGMIFLGGLLFNKVRRHLKPLSIKGFGLFCLPMAIDGFGQLFGLWESTWWSRVGTGALFGLACVWLAFPYLEEGMREVYVQMQQLLRDEGT